MSSSSPVPLHLTATRVAEYFRFGCERQLRYDLVPSERRGGEVPAPNADPAAGPLVGPRPGSALLTEAGRRWERRALKRLIARVGAERVAFAGWRADGEPARLRPERVAELLRDPDGIDFLVQPELRLADPAAFLAEHGIDPALVELAPAAPDLIRVRRGPQGQLRFQVVDIKASREARVPHFAQVAFYTLLLEAVCREAGVDAGLVDTRWARVWARDGRGARTFRLGAYRHHVRHFLQGELPRLAALAPAVADWHVAPRCAGCAYLEHCRAEADRTDAVCRVAGLTPLAGRVLREKGIATVAALAKSHRRDTWTGCHALETDAELLKLRAQATAWKKLFETRGTTQLMSAREDVRVILSAEGDPVSGRCFALGVRVEGLGGRGGAEPHVFVAEAPTAAAERTMLARLLAVVMDAFAAVERANVERAGRPLSAHLYVWDRAELAVLRELIER
ncbi:MAG TPA: hypothetical protein VFX29_07430, partial [Longimicrobiaceae bacterium]|nr:hypothetical protein [Longimicrobiaceae bacterium]